MWFRLVQFTAAPFSVSSISCVLSLSFFCQFSSLSCFVFLAFLFPVFYFFWHFSSCSCVVFHIWFPFFVCFFCKDNPNASGGWVDWWQIRRSRCPSQNMCKWCKWSLRVRITGGLVSLNTCSVYNGEKTSNCVQFNMFNSQNLCKWSLRVKITGALVFLLRAETIQAIVIVLLFLRTVLRIV